MTDHKSHAGHDDHHSGHAHHRPAGSAIVAAAGSTHAAHGGHDHAAMIADFRRRFWISLALTPPILLLSPMIRHWLGLGDALAFPGSGLVLFALSTIVYVYGGRPFLTGFASELRDRQPGMMTLIALAISAAYFYSAAVTFGLPGESFYWELATLITIMLLGHWLEMRSVMGASRALEELVRLLPDTATKIGADGATQDVPISALQPGDRVLIRPGAKVPVDGKIIEGASSFNEAMLTGESRPVSKAVGANAIGGAINGEGSVTIEVTATGDKTYLAQVITLVKEAQASRSRTQDLANRAAAWLTYIALTVGIGTLVVWLTLGAPFQFAIERMVTVMVIACPHALGLAVPLVVAVSTSLSAGNGLLIRDRAAFERARNLNAVVFDKTGTLTEGRFGVSDIVLLAGDEAEALRYAAAAESRSEHPIAHGILAEAKRRGLVPPPAGDVRNITGEGIAATVGGEDVRIVSPGHLARQGNPVGGERLKQLEAQGKTVVVLVRGGVPQALLALADIVRPESREAIAELKRLGVNSVMLTGDAAGVAKAVSEDLGIAKYFAEVLPDQKSAKIKELQARGLKVAMVGDGVNDAPALVQADLGVAIGAGTDVAVESADIVLVRSDPRDVAAILGLSRATYRKMVQNLIWATAYNVIAIPMAAGITFGTGFLMTPAVGAIFMSASTIIVAINAQLLRFYRTGN
ncbi:copper-translocating P-type ATPase [Pseudochelatococcus contaminans]|uniref:Cu2+-exporting ATPase n=1 Tax=Pseudochelatococcus contaminans TaxID=1538103 RepID=A0A7W5Z763_9HYPH|nr:copper-translocating P-type ATPase [Pseudochelatococcus contaminans]MBB3810932.1 Cu2+-exporting ATPase [Pseudochelatococcus contaminans]